METPAPRKPGRADGSTPKPPKPPRTVYNLHLPTSDYVALAAAADAEERSIAVVLRRLIRRYVAEQAALGNGDGLPVAAGVPVSIRPDAVHAA